MPIIQVAKINNWLKGSKMLWIQFYKLFWALALSINHTFKVNHGSIKYFFKWQCRSTKKNVQGYFFEYCRILFWLVPNMDLRRVFWPFLCYYAIESTADIFSSTLVYIGLRYVTKPADEDHPTVTANLSLWSGFMVVFSWSLSAAVIIPSKRSFIFRRRIRHKSFTYFSPAPFDRLERIFVSVYAQQKALRPAALHWRQMHGITEVMPLSSTHFTWELPFRRSYGSGLWTVLGWDYLQQLLSFIIATWFLE